MMSQITKLLICLIITSPIAFGDEGKTFKLWLTSDAHIDGTKTPHTLADAIIDSERDFEWDIMLHLGDMADPTAFLWRDDEDGRQVHSDLSASTKHEREDFYFLAGNHEATPDQLWFKKWISPTKHTRRYPVTGTWERYSFQVGNILILMMSDRNDGKPPAGREGNSWGGYPAGRVTQETFEWWKQVVEDNQDKIILSCHHHMLEDTTTASGLWDTMRQDKDGNWIGTYHGYCKEGAPGGASFLYFTGEKPHARSFEKYLEAHPGAIDMWLGAHTHILPGEIYQGKSCIERKWGIAFFNVSGLVNGVSWLMTFTEGSNIAKLECYLHNSDCWYLDANREIKLRKLYK